MTARPFGDWLDVTHHLQQDKYGIDPEQLEGSAYAEYLRLNFTAAVVELGEYMQEANWKPYKVEGRNDPRRTKRIEEMVDALHHIANMLVLDRVTDAELSDTYLGVVERNRQRADHHMMATQLRDAHIEGD